MGKINTFLLSIVANSKRFHPRAEARGMGTALEVTPCLALGRLPVCEFSVCSCQEQDGVRDILNLEKAALGVMVLKEH